MSTLEEVHDCPKSHGKVVHISMFMGVQRCGYCGAVVGYSKVKQ